MHEMSLCEGILGVIEEAARTQTFRKVRRVRLEVGRFAGVEPEALRFGFAVVMEGSLADGATLEIIDLPGRAVCLGCARTVTIEDRFDPCPECGDLRLAPSGGDELRIKDLEVI